MHNRLHSHTFTFLLMIKQNKIVQAKGKARGHEHCVSCCGVSCRKRDVQKSIMKLYPNVAHVEGKWVIIKCNSSPDRLNAKLLGYLRFHVASFCFLASQT